MAENQSSPQGLFEQGFQQFLQERDGDLNAGTFDLLPRLFPDRFVAGGVEEFMAGSGRVNSWRAAKP